MPEDMHKAHTPSALAVAASAVLILAATIAVACSHVTSDGQVTGYPGGDGGVTWPLTFDGGTYEVDGAPPTVNKMACTDQKYADPWTPGYSIDPKVEKQVGNIVAEMTVTEAADQMRGTTNGGGSNYGDIFRTYDNPGKNIRGYHFRDGPRGACLNAELPAGGDGFSTAFPVPEARTAAFDMDLEYQIGEAIGEEVLTSVDPLTGSPNTMVLAPMINVLRHPLWGRAQETYGEDSFEMGRLGTAFAAGAQTYIPACAKHFAAYDIEDGRASNNSELDEQTLREHYTPHFGAVIRDAGVSCIMASYNLVQIGPGANPTKTTIDKHLLTDILRDDFGFKGFILTDWWAMPPGTAFATSDALQANAAAGVYAGLDMELPWSYNYQQLEALAAATGGNIGAIPPSAIYASATRILLEKYRFNVGDLVSRTVGMRAPTTTFTSKYSIANNDAHIALARQAEIEGAVLLKNDNNTLPINTSTVKTIAVVGAHVDFHVPFGGVDDSIDFSDSRRSLAGGGQFLVGDLGSSRVYSDPAKSSGPFDGVSAAAGSGITVIQGDDSIMADANTPSCMAPTCCPTCAEDAAMKADFVVVVVGLTPEDEGEEYTGAGDRFSLALDAKWALRTGNPEIQNFQNNLVTKIAALGKPMVVVIEAGSVIDMPWLSKVPALVMAWYPGMDGGNALGQLLLGKANFSGKLPMTWPKCEPHPDGAVCGCAATDAACKQNCCTGLDDEPQFRGATTTPFDYYVGYQYFDHYMKQPEFAFGHGLSYTTFKYSNLQVPCSTVTPNGVVYVQADVTNTGAVAGDEIALLFTSYPQATVRSPAKELKAFQRVTLNPGQTKRVTLPIRLADLKYWDTNANAWHPRTGVVQIQVGGSSDNLSLSDMMTVVQPPQ